MKRNFLSSFAGSHRAMVVPSLCLGLGVALFQQGAVADPTLAAKTSSDSGENHSQHEGKQDMSHGKQQSRHGGRHGGRHHFGGHEPMLHLDPSVLSEDARKAFSALKTSHEQTHSKVMALCGIKTDAPSDSGKHGNGHHGSEHHKAIEACRKEKTAEFEALHSAQKSLMMACLPPRIHGKRQPPQPADLEKSLLSNGCTEALAKAVQPGEKAAQ